MNDELMVYSYLTNYY